MIESINKLINTNDFSGIIFLFGEEEFLLELSYDKLVNHICPGSKSNYDFETFDSEDVNLERIVDSCQSYPFLSEKRIVIIRHFEKFFKGRASKKDMETSFAKYISNPLDTTILIIKCSYDKLFGFGAKYKKARSEEEKLKIIKKVKFPYNTLLSNSKWIEFPKVYESKFSSWVSDAVRNHGYSIDHDAIELLIAQTNPTLRDLNNEITKLTLYLTDRKNITFEDVSFISGTSRNYNIFELQKAIGKRDISTAIEILENILSSGRQEMLIMTMLTRYFLVLWKLIDISKTTTNQYQIAGKIGVNPFFVPEYLTALNKYRPEEIDSAFFYLTEADELLKSSPADKLMLIQKMLIQIMSVTK